MAKLLGLLTQTLPTLYLQSLDCCHLFSEKQNVDTLSRPALITKHLVSGSGFVRISSQSVAMVLWGSPVSQWQWLCGDLQSVSGSGSVGISSQSVAMVLCGSPVSQWQWFCADLQSVSGNGSVGISSQSVAVVLWGSPVSQWQWSCGNLQSRRQPDLGHSYPLITVL